MKLLVGLGNPGKKYQYNRHNVGFMILDFIQEKLEGGKWRVEKRMDSEMSTIEVDGEKIILAKPQTFMNESGVAVRRLTNNRQQTTYNNLIVAHDDLDIRLGEYKIQLGRGPKLHNGIESIENALGTKDFWRIRIGVDNRSVGNRIPGEVYTLQNFTDEENQIITKIFAEIYKNLFQILHSTF